jgi:uncharacterized membrane protein YeaQ/YmgE (transglycosylase-associated protein family)
LNFHKANRDEDGGGGLFKIILTAVGIVVLQFLAEATVRKAPWLFKFHDFVQKVIGAFLT